MTIAEGCDGKQHRHIKNCSYDDQPAQHGSLSMASGSEGNHSKPNLSTATLGLYESRHCLRFPGFSTHGFCYCPTGFRQAKLQHRRPVPQILERQMLKEFQEFISRGNVMDLAVGVIIGGAFGKIVDSLVNDIIMPIVGAIFGGLDFNNYFLPLSSAVTATSLEAAKQQGAVFAYGSFITVLLNFVILAWIIFLMVKAVNNVRRRVEGQPAAAADAPPPADVALLTEIRDLLARK
jgi:large conductance mechanosensitive channel